MLHVYGGLTGVTYLSGRITSISRCVLFTSIAWMDSMERSPCLFESQLEMPGEHCMVQEDLDYLPASKAGSLSSKRSLRGGLFSGKGVVINQFGCSGHYFNLASHPGS